MDFKIQGDRKNALLGRREVAVRIAHPGKSTPLRREIISLLSKELKVGEDLVVVDKIFTMKGTASCEARVLIYPKKEDIPTNKAEKQSRRLKKGKSAAGDPKEPEAKAGEKEPPKEEATEAPEGKKPEKTRETPEEGGEAAKTEGKDEKKPKDEKPSEEKK